MRPDPSGHAPRPSPRLDAQELADLWFAGLAFLGIYRRLVLLERPVSPAVPRIQTRTSMRVNLLGPDELTAYLAFRPDQSGEGIRRRLKEGHVCFAVWHEARIVHAAWVAVGRAPIEYLARDLSLGPDEVFVFDAFTAPAFRGHGASPLRALAVGQHFGVRGYRRVLTAVHPENRTGFRPLEKVGSRRVGIVGYAGIGPWRWHFCRRAQ
jgi:GNAT superfamily N-acetyltransferase